MLRLIVFSFLMLLFSCATIPHCYIANESKIVAYKYEKSDLSVLHRFHEVKRHEFYDKNDNLFYFYESKETPKCVPCDSTFKDKLN